MNAGWQENLSACHFGHTCCRFVSLELDGSELQLPPGCTMAKCSNYTLSASVTGQSACTGQIIHLYLKLSMFRAINSAQLSIATSAVTLVQEQNFNKTDTFNPLNAELNPIYHLLALLGGATIVVVSRLRVKIDFFLYLRNKKYHDI